MRARGVALVIAGIALFSGCGGDENETSGNPGAGGGGSDKEQVTQVVDEAMALYSARDGVTSEVIEEGGRLRFSSSAPICEFVASSDGCVIGEDTEAGECTTISVEIEGSDGEFGFAEDTGENPNLYAAKTAFVEIDCTGIGTTSLELGNVDGQWLIEDLSDVE